MTRIAFARFLRAGGADYHIYNRGLPLIYNERLAKWAADARCHGQDFASLTSILSKNAPNDRLTPITMASVAANTA
jgi:hypothetical protein